MQERKVRIDSQSRSGNLNNIQVPDHGTTLYPLSKDLCETVKVVTCYSSSGKEVAPAYNTIYILPIIQNNRFITHPIKVHLDLVVECSADPTEANRLLGSILSITINASNSFHRIFLAE